MSGFESKFHPAIASAEISAVPWLSCLDSEQLALLLQLSCIFIFFCTGGGRGVPTCMPKLSVQVIIPLGRPLNGRKAAGSQAGEGAGPRAASVPDGRGRGRRVMLCFIVSERAKAAPLLAQQKAQRLKEVLHSQGYVAVAGREQAVLSVGGRWVSCVLTASSTTCSPWHQVGIRLSLRCFQTFM